MGDGGADGPNMGLMAGWRRLKGGDLNDRRDIIWFTVGSD